MNTFDRHLLSEWLQILVLVVVAVLGLTVLQICYDEMRTMLEAGAKVRDVLIYVGVTMPSFFAVILPITILVSLLFSLGKLHRANELTAMRAAGIGFGRITLPIWVVGLFACAGVWWLNSTVVPWSVERSEQLKNDLEFRKQAKSLTADKVGALYDVAFDEPAQHRMWFFNRFSQATGRGYGAMVSQTDANGDIIHQLSAAEAYPDPKGGGWVFLNGRDNALDQITHENLANVPFKEKRVAEYHEDPQLMLLTDRRPQDLSWFELKRLMNYFQVQNPAQGVPYAVRYYSILADAVAPLIVIAIAIPFSVTGVRVNPAIGVAKSLGLFFFYYLLNFMMQGLATKGWVDPQAAAWVPDIAMALFAAVLFLRLR